MNLILNNYPYTGSFSFKVGDILKTTCNAPIDKSGIYLFYGIQNEVKTLIYIGCSGHITNEGSLSTRKSGCGGIKGRIVNGHQFGKKQRWEALREQMILENIETLEIHWYVTFNDNVQHSPIYVESCLLQEYFDKNRCLPKWNQKF